MDYYSLQLIEELEIILCTICQAIIPHRTIPHHVQRYHKMRNFNPNLKIWESMLPWNSLPDAYTNYDGKPLPPINGVKIHDGYKCGSCLFVCQALGAMKQHKSLTGCSSHVQCRVQKVSFSPPIKYVSVTDAYQTNVTNGSNSGPLGDQNHFALMDFYSNFDNNDTIKSQDSRLLTGFDAEAGWTEYIYQFNEEHVVQSTSIPKPTDEMNQYCILTMELYKEIHQLIREVSYETRKLFSANGSENILRPLQEDESISKYATMASKLCMFTIRVVRNSQLLPGLEVSSEISEACQNLISETMSRKQALIELFFAIITQPMKLFGIRRESFLYNFANLESKRSGQPLNVSEIPQKLAQIKYLCRSILLLKLHQITHDEQKRNEMLKWVHPDGNTSYGFICSISKWASTNVHLMDKPIEVIWIDTTSFSVLIYKSIKVSINDFKMAYRKGIETLKSMLEAALLDCRIPYDVTAKDFNKDGMGNSEIGYSFLDLKKKLRYILCDKLNLFRKVDGTMNDKACAVYLSSCTKIISQILFLIHISAGQPARASEICYLKFRNDEKQKRNVFIYNNRVVIQQVYSKTTHIPRKVCHISTPQQWIFQGSRPAVSLPR